MGRYARAYWSCGRVVLLHLNGKKSEMPVECKDCGYIADFLCDHPIGTRGKTCDRPLCRHCRCPIGANKDYCKAHFAEEEKRFADLAKQTEAGQGDASEAKEGEGVDFVDAASLRPIVVNVKTCGLEFHEYIGRAGFYNNTQFDVGYFGNPIIRGRVCLVCKKIHHNPKDTIPCYKVTLWKQIKEDAVFRWACRGLAGLRIACHCAPAPCHGDVLADAVVFLHSKDGRLRFPRENIIHGKLLAEEATYGEQESGEH